MPCLLLLAVASITSASPHSRVLNIPFLDKYPDWKSCDEMPCIEGFVCVERKSEQYTGPLCVHAGPVTCALVDCSSGLKCIYEEVICKKEPCYPQPKCIPMTNRCSKNEHWDQCGGCENTCEQPDTVCAALCQPDKAGCRCNSTLVRTSNKECVSLDRCEKQKISMLHHKCKALHCKYGQKCLLQGPSMRCGMNSAVRCDCAAAELCILQIIQCFTTPCDPIPICVSETLSCNNIPCPAGQACMVISGFPRCMPSSSVPNPTSQCVPACTAGQTCLTNVQGIAQCLSTTTNAQGCILQCANGQVCMLSQQGIPQCVSSGITTPQQCTLQCPAGQVCLMSAQGAPQCVVSGGTGSVCNLQCPAGQICTVGLTGAQQCVSTGITTPQYCNLPCTTGQICMTSAQGIPQCIVSGGTGAICTLPCSTGQICMTSVQGYQQCVSTGTSSCTPPCSFGQVCMISQLGQQQCVTANSGIQFCNLQCATGKICIIIQDFPQCTAYPGSAPTVCNINESINYCGNLCENKCQSIFTGPTACPAICAPAACTCNPGFYREESTNLCVLQCPRPGWWPGSSSSSLSLSSGSSSSGDAGVVGFPGTASYPGGIYPGNGYPSTVGLPTTVIPGYQVTYITGNAANACGAGFCSPGYYCSIQYTGALCLPNIVV